jgi:hypothetical protein
LILKERTYIPWWTVVVDRIGQQLDTSSLWKGNEGSDSNAPRGILIKIPTGDNL